MVALSINWDLMTILYFFFSGISTGAVILASLSLAFGLKRYQPIAGLALITGLVFGIMTPLTIIPHLAQPARWWTMATVFQFTSPMSWGVWILVIYLALILLGGRFAYTAALAEAYSRRRGTTKAFYSILLLGRTNLTPSVEKTATNLARVLLGAAFFASLLFIYQGFEIGILAARPLWLTSTTPFLFLLTAASSGFGVVLMGWLVLNWFTTEKELKIEMLSELAGVITVLLVIFIALNIGEYLTSLSADAYRQVAVSALFTGTNLYAFVLTGIVMGAVIPVILLAFPRGRRSAVVLLLCSILLIVGTFAVKLAIIVGGQMFAKVPALPPTLTDIAMSSAEFQMGLGATALAVFLYLLGVWLLPWRHYATSGE